MTEKTPTLLIIEDNADDLFLVRRALRPAAHYNVQVAEDGQEALDYLGGVGRYADRGQFPLPALVLLDLKLPYIHGFQVLTWLRSHPKLKELPVIMLSSSPEDKDREKAAELGALGYFVKPPPPQLAVQVAQVLQPQANGTAS